MESQLPGLYRDSVDARRRRIAEVLGIGEGELLAALDAGGLSEREADRLIENVVGTYALPLAFATNFVIDGRAVLVPMAIEEPSVVAAASSAAKRLGGFITEADPPIAVAQVYLEGATNELSDSGRARVRAEADRVLPGIVERGGGARAVHVDVIGDVVRVHVEIDVRDAMGANSADTVAEAVAPILEEELGGHALLRILSNLALERRVRVSCRVLIENDVAERIVRATRIAHSDPRPAATHNKGVLNGVDAVAIATGNDWRAIEAGAHAFAAREGYGSLTTWEMDGPALVGRLELPLAMGIVGGTIDAHRAARFAIAATGVERGVDLARIAASAGLATNFAALRALVTEGIQAGHMPLQGRSRR